MEKFTWGRILNVFEVGPYKIVQYDRYACNSKPRRCTGEVSYHCYINDEDTCRGASTLDEALLICIGYQHLGPNSSFGGLAAKMLGLDGGHGGHELMVLAYAANDGDMLDAIQIGRDIFGEVAWNAFALDGHFQNLSSFGELEARNAPKVYHYRARAFRLDYPNHRLLTKLVMMRLLTQGFEAPGEVAEAISGMRDGMRTSSEDVKDIRRAFGRLFPKAYEHVQQRQARAVQPEK